jgi:hypothetical protein
VCNDVSSQPLVLADDWKDRVIVRGYTLLGDANVAARRQAIAVAAKDKGSSPAQSELLGTAQAQIFAFNGDGHDDLWHMDWRARLTRFTFGSTSGDASSAAGAQAIVQKLQDLAMSSGAQGLADQFMVH